MNKSLSTIGIIGGSGIYQIEGIEILNEHTIETPFGQPSDKIVEAKLGGVEFFFLARHRRDHHFLPHEVNYRANIFAMKTLGVKKLISVSAVGSLKEELPPRTFVFPDQFVDWTKGQRERSFFGKGIVGHVSVANPVDEQLQDVLVQSAEENNINFSRGGSYLCIEGPQFSSKAESRIYRSFDASVIGMTNVPEAYLAKEAGMAYATLAMVTDYDCWKEVHCTVDEIMKVMKDNNVAAQGVLKSALKKLEAADFEVITENEIGIMSDRNKLSTEQQKIVDILLR